MTRIDCLAHMARVQLNCVRRRKKSLQWETNKKITPFYQKGKQHSELYSVKGSALALSQSLEEPEIRTWISLWAQQ